MYIRVQTASLKVGLGAVYNTQTRNTQRECFYVNTRRVIYYYVVSNKVLLMAYVSALE